MPAAPVGKREGRLDPEGTGGQGPGQGGGGPNSSWPVVAAVSLGAGDSFSGRCGRCLVVHAALECCMCVCVRVCAHT